MRTLKQAIEDYGHQAFLIAASDDGPHTSVVDVTLDAQGLSLTLGRTASRYVASNPHVSLLWPAKDEGGYNVIVNGIVAGSPALSDEYGSGNTTIQITKSVFHRPGASRTDGAACTSDCLPLSYP
ncbi:MAG: hypothetical protein AAF493_26635 [Pseudomonadota bacterium]